MAKTLATHRIGYQSGAGEWLRSVMTGSVSVVPARFIDGDHVEVLNERGEVIGDGIIGRTIRDEKGEAHFVTGFSATRQASQLRLILRGR